MAPETKYKLSLATVLGLLTLGGILLTAGGSWAKVKDALPALELKVENHIKSEDLKLDSHISKEELRNEKTMDVISNAVSELKALRQAIEDLRYEVRHGKNETIKAINQQ